jgi:hypothetical protein
LTAGVEELAHRARRLRAPGSDLAPCEANDLKPKCLQLDVTRSVALERDSPTVRSVPVQVGNEASRHPEEVHDVRADANIHPWLWKAVTAQQGGKAGFELAPSVVGLEPVIEWEAEEFSLTEGRGEVRLRKEAGEVPKRPRRGCRPYGLHRSERGWLTGARDPRWVPAVGRNGDVHETPLGNELPERRRAGVAQDRFRAAGEHRCHPSSLLG